MEYLIGDCELVVAADRRQFRSSNIATFIIPRNYTRLGDRAFPVAGPRPTCDSMQFDFTLLRFCRGVKDVFVSLTEIRAPSDFCLQCAIQMLLLIYLLNCDGLGVKLYSLTRYIITFFVVVVRVSWRETQLQRRLPRRRLHGGCRLHSVLEPDQPRPLPAPTTCNTQHPAASDAHGSVQVSAAGNRRRRQFPLTSCGQSAGKHHHRICNKRQKVIIKR